MSRVPTSIPANSPITSRAWLLLGVGLGGFVDGIVLHQILQWHHMLSAINDQPVDTIAGLETNTLADGLFHLAALVITLLGVAWLRRSEARGIRAGATQVVGAMLVGWGVFNLVEGLVNHHLLGLHHVRDDVADPPPWDIGFLVISAAFVAFGALLMRRPQTPTPDSEPSPKTSSMASPNAIEPGDDS